MKAINRNLEQIADKLRACTILPEYDLWHSLCACADDSIQILRQVSIGGFIADIFFPAQGLIIDVGGDTMEWAQSNTEERDAELRRLGLRQLVVHNNEIKESLSLVVERILAES